MKKILSLFLSLLCVAGAATACGDGASSRNFDDLLTQKYNYDLSPYLELAEYKGLPAQGYRYEVTDEMVTEQILATRSYYARLTDVTDRGAQMGDTVYIDYVGTIDGEEFDGGSEEDCELVLGTGTFMDGFEEAIVGAYPETELSFDLTVPDPYPELPEYAGTTIHFEVHVHNVCEQELPDYSEDFVRAYLGYDSIADFEANVRQVILENYESRYNQYIIGQTWAAVLENTTVKQFPEEETQKMFDDFISAEKYYAERQGINFPVYIEVNYQKTEEEFYDYVMESVEANIKDEMLCYAIARAENITLTEEEYITRATEYATEQYGLESLEAFEALYSRETICRALLTDIVKETVAGYANVTFE